MEAMIFYLPWPTSTNTNWRKGNNKMYLSKPYRVFKRDASIEIMMTKQLKGYKASREGTQYHVQIVLFPPDNRKYDIDNRIKAILDVLTINGVWTDDSLVNSIDIGRGLPTPGGKAFVKITERNYYADPIRYGLARKQAKTKKKSRM